MSGDNPLIWDINTLYVDPGIIALDNYDDTSNLTTSIENNIDINNVGLYDYIYTVKDSANNVSTVTRQVYVLDKTVLQNIPVIDISGDSSNNVTNITNNSLNTQYTPDNGLLLSDDFIVNFVTRSESYRVRLTELSNMYNNLNNIVVLVYGFENETITIENVVAGNNYLDPYITSSLEVGKLVNLVLDNNNNYKLLILNGKHNVLFDNVV